MSSSFDYRVKFRDMRIKPPRDEGGQAKASSSRHGPEQDAPEGKCEFPGCASVGEHKAPKHRDRGDFYRFCQAHAAEYNRGWNFFEGMSASELAAFNQDATYGHQKTWRFGTGPMAKERAAHAHDPRHWRGRAFFEDDAGRAERKTRESGPRPRLQTQAYETLNLKVSATPAEVRARYFELVKTLHPDSNGGDRSTEHRLTLVIRAFKTLKAAGLA
jgi:hypothetical protein